MRIRAAVPIDQVCHRSAFRLLFKRVCVCNVQNLNRNSREDTDRVVPLLICAVQFLTPMGLARQVHHSAR